MTKKLPSSSRQSTTTRDPLPVAEISHYVRDDKETPVILPTEHSDEGPPATGRDLSY